MSARYAAYLSLYGCERDGRYSNLEIDSAIKKYKLEGAEKGLYTTLVYGAIERMNTLDYIIGQLSSKPLDALDIEVKLLLKLGLYQLIWLDRVPDSAAVNESVELAKKICPRSSNFINAVLRGFLRTMGKDNLPYPDKRDWKKYLSVRYSCSEDVISLLCESVDDIESLLAAFERQPEPTLRVNTLKIDRGELLNILENENIPAEPTKYSPFGVKLKNHTISSKISELIASGYVYIQDEASQLAIAVAAPKPGMRVIDSCACPGGKSFSAALLMENCGKVMSFDLHKNKLSLIESGAKRLGIDIISTAEKNGSIYDEAIDSSADVVLCDVPCSGLGVIAKKPEIRYKSRADIDRLPEIQYSILANSARYVKPSGRLLYSTCTLNRTENGAVVERFIASNPDFKLTEFSVGELKSESGMLTLRPDIHETDGFFICLLTKKA